MSTDTPSSCAAGSSPLAASSTTVSWSSTTPRSSGSARPTACRRGGPRRSRAARRSCPGLVDLHCHGGGGASFPDAVDAADAQRAVDEHRRHGTTSLVASLVTAPPDVLLRRTAVLAGLADAGEIVGIHLEGPFLSADRCGAQNPADMLDGDPELVRSLAEAAHGHLVTMTVAPEVPGADEVVAALVDVGAVPSIGHTDATAEQVDEAVDRGFDLLAARSNGRLTATHLFNGMRPLHHRDPGPIAACLAAAARGELVVELVADGTHLADGTVRSVFDLVGAGSIALVTDAMAAAGMPDGEYRLGPMAVRVADGVARIADETGAIAGGVAHLLDVVRNVVAAGIPLEDAVLAAATVPGRRARPSRPRRARRGPPRGPRRHGRRPRAAARPARGRLGLAGFQHDHRRLGRARRGVARRDSGSPRSRPSTAGPVPARRRCGRSTGRGSSPSRRTTASGRASRLSHHAGCPSIQPFIARVTRFGPSSR